MKNTVVTQTGSIPQLPPDLAASFRGKGRGERNEAAKPSGTGNEFKKMRPHPTKPDRILYEDPHTGKSVEKPKPQGFDDWLKSKKGR